MRELLLIFNLKAHTFLKSVFRWDWQALLKNGSSVIIFGGFAVAVFFISRFTTAYLLQQAHIGEFLFHRFLSMLLYVFFITVNLGNMIVCYATLYRSEEVNFLMAMPVSHAKIFLIKFVDNFFYSSTTLSLVGLAVLLGYGSYFSLPWYYYFFTIFLVLLPFMLIAGIIAVVTLMLLIKIAARIGVRWLLGTIIVGYLAAIYTYFKVTNPVQLVSEVMKHYPDVNEYFGYLDPPFVRYLPNHWVTEFLYWSTNGDYSRAIPYLSLLFLTMVGLIVLGGLMAHRYYYQSWLAASDMQAMRGPATSRFRLRFLEFGGKSFLSPQTNAFLKRDIWLFLREPSQWLHLLLMLILLCIFLISIGALDLKINQPLMQAVSFLVIFLFNGFLIASIALRFVFPSVSLEGEAFWAVRSAPVSMNKLYWHKFTWAFFLVLIVAEGLTVSSVSLVRNDVVLLSAAAICMGFIALSLTSLNMGAGTYFAGFNEKNPIRVASSQGASLTFLASMAYLTTVVAVLIMPLNRFFEVKLLQGTSLASGMYTPVVIVGLLSMLVFALSTSIGIRAMKRDY